MGGLESVMIVSVLIQARDMASRVFRAMGITAGTAYGSLAMGALAVGAGIAVIGTAAIKAATDFDQGMQKIAALTDTSQAQMESYKASLLAMAPALDQTPRALADGLYFVISAGYKGADALNILKLSAQAAASTMTPMKDVSDLLTTAMNAYRGANLSAGHAMDDIMKVVVNGKVTMSSLATSFGFVAVTAKNAGLSFDEASAAVSTLSQVAGQHGSRRVMMDLDNALRQLGPRMELVSAKAEKLKNLKAPWDAAKFAALDFMGKLRYIAQETGGVGYLDKTQAAAYAATGNFKNLAQATAHANKNFMDLVGGAAAFLPTAMLLSDKGAEYDHILKQMGGDGHATAQSFDIMRQSTAQQARMFEIMGQTILTNLGLHILPVVNGLLHGLYQIGEAVNGWIAQSQNITTLKWALLGIGLVVGAILLPAILSLTAAAAPWLLIIGGIIAAGILLGNVVRQVVAHFGGWHAIMTKLHPVIQQVQQVFTQAWGEIRKALANPDIQRAWKELQAALPQLLPVLKVLAVVVGGALYLGFKLFVAVLVFVIGLVPTFLRVLAGIANVIGGITRFVQGIGPALAAFWSALVHAAQAALAAFVNAILAPFRAIGAAFVWLYNHNRYVHLLVDLVVGAFHRLWTKLTAIMETIKKLLEGAWKTVTDKVTQVWDTITGFLGGLASKVGTAIHKGVIDPIGTAVGSLLSTALTWGENLLKQFIQGISNKLGDLKSMVQGAAKTVWNFLGFHSPTKEGPGADADTWAPNFIRMFAQGLLAGSPVIGLAAGQMATSLATGLVTGGAAGATLATGAVGGSLAGLGGGGLGAGGSSTHTYNLHFPNATDGAQIKAALHQFMDERERRTYQRSRRAGFGGGLRPGL